MCYRVLDSPGDHNRAHGLDATPDRSHLLSRTCGSGAASVVARILRYAVLPTADAAYHIAPCRSGSSPIGVRPHPEGTVNRTTTMPPDDGGKNNRPLAGRYLDYAELAELSRIPVGSLRNMRSAGKLQVKAFRIGQRVVFDYASAVAWIESVPA